MKLFIFFTVFNWWFLVGFLLVCGHFLHVRKVGLRSHVNRKHMRD